MSLLMVLTTFCAAAAGVVGGAGAAFAGFAAFEGFGGLGDWACPYTDMARIAKTVTINLRVMRAPFADDFAGYNGYKCT